MDPRVGEMLTRYVADRTAEAPVTLAAAAVLVALAVAIRAWRPTLAPLVVAAAVVAGLALAWQQLALFDDAFISFRYARNLVWGRGLVFNGGEYVQGFTNPLWTLFIALGLAVVPGSAPYVSLLGNAASFVANVVVIAAIGRRVQQGGPHVPLAALLVAVQTTMTAFASSGLETTPASLLVNLSLLALLSRDDWRGALLAGLAAALSTLCRPDHLLFHAAAGLVVLVRVAPGWGASVCRAPGCGRGGRRASIGWWP